jgi:meiotically up-regulated gene 157 (Mug157) protein
MIYSKSYFRPSDDATTLPFHIPSNAMAVVELNHLAILTNQSGPTYDEQLSKDASALAASINDALLKCLFVYGEC